MGSISSCSDRSRFGQRHLASVYNGSREFFICQGICSHEVRNPGMFIGKLFLFWAIGKVLRSYPLGRGLSCRFSEKLLTVLRLVHKVKVKAKRGGETGVQPTRMAGRESALSFYTQEVRLVKSSITVRISERMIWLCFLAGCRERNRIW